MVWVMELVTRHPILFTFSLLILIPFLTDYATTKVFYRRHRTRSVNKKPPTIPYWVPGVFHGLGLLSKPSAYFALILKKYGDCAPFAVKVGLTSYTVLRDPEHIQQVFMLLDGMIPRNSEYYDKVLAAPKEVINIYKNYKPKSSEASEQLYYAHVKVPRKHLTGTSLEQLASKYIEVFQRNMSNKMFQIGTWTQIQDFWSFLEIEITRATAETLFGTELLKQYPKLGRDLWDFENKIEEFLPGLPRWNVASAAVPRGRLVEGLKKWLQSTHGGSDFARVSEADPEWDGVRGSKFIQQRDDVFAKLPAFGYQGRAVESLDILHRLATLTLQTTFHTILQVLNNPALTSFLHSEISKHHTCNNNMHTYDILAISDLPNIRSLLTEITRLRLPTYLAHKTSTPIPLSTADKSNTTQWTLPKSTHALTFTLDIALNTPLWTKTCTTPQTAHILSRPLTEFWPERFLVPEKSLQKRYRNFKDRDSVTSGTFSVEGVETLVAGSRISVEEREFVEKVVVGVLGVLLVEWEVEICVDIEDELGMGGGAFGGCKVEGVEVRIRRRKGI